MLLIRHLIFFLSNPIFLAFGLLFVALMLKGSPLHLLAQFCWFIAGVVLFISIFTSVPYYALESLENDARSQFTASSKETSGVVVLLVSGFEYDNELKNADRLTEKSLRRFAEAIRLYNNSPRLIRALVISGGGKKEMLSQGLILRNLAIESGVDANDIFMLKNPENTIGEARELLTLANENSNYADRLSLNDNKFQLVTSAYHMKRALIIFKNLGHKPLARPTNYLIRRLDERGSLHGLNLDGTTYLSLYLREVFGLCWWRIISSNRP